MEQYARHGCEAWAREGRIELGLGACAGRPRSAHRTFSRGYTQADRAVWVSGLGATLPAPSEGWQARRARHRDRAQCVLPQRRRAVPCLVGSGDALIQRRTRACGRSPTIDRAQKDESDLRGPGGGGRGSSQGGAGRGYAAWARHGGVLRRARGCAWRLRAARFDCERCPARGSLTPVGCVALGGVVPAELCAFHVASVAWVPEGESLRTVEHAQEVVLRVRVHHLRVGWRCV